MGIALSRKAYPRLFASVLMPLPFVCLGNPVDAAQSDETAADSHRALEQVIVVAHKDRRSIRQIAANVTTLTQDTLRAELVTSVNDALRYLPGIDYEASGTRFGTEGINIRGIGGNRVAIYVDGVPLPDQFDVGSFSNATRDFIDAGLVRDIEVLHGPASALYGSAAIGGVVAATTPLPDDIARDGMIGGEWRSTWRGDDNSVHTQGLLGAGDDSRGLVLGLSWRKGEQMDSAAAGDSLDDRDYQRRSALLKLMADDPWGNSWRVSLVRQDAQVDSDLDSLLGTGRYRSTTALEGDDRYTMNVANLAYHFSAEDSFFDDGVAQVFARNATVKQFTLDERGNARIPVSIDRLFAFEQRVRGLEVNLWKNIQNRYFSQRVAFGLQYQQRETEEYRDGLQTNLNNGEQTNNLLGEIFPLRDFPISEGTVSAAYIEDTITAGKLTLIAALRADRFELEPQVDTMYLEDFPFSEPVSLDESDISPKLGLTYQLNPEIDFYLQYAHGFRAPPYSDANIGLEIPLFNIRAVSNPDLKSESSRGIDVGFRFVGRDMNAQLSLFKTDYKDFIETKVRLGVDPESGRILFQSQNLREAEIEGIEGSIRWQFGGPGRPFGVDASAYYARGTNEESGAALNSVGPPQAVLGASWHSPDDRRQLRLKATFTRSWSRRDESGGDLFMPAGYGLLDLYYSQRVGSNTTLRAGLHNLTDRTYWHWADIRGLSPTDPTLPYLARAGRTVSLSFSVDW